MIRLRLAYWVAQVCNADARDHRRVAKNGWRAGEVVKESNSGAKKNRGNVDVDFVEEASIQQLLDRVSTVDPNGLHGGGGFGLVHGAFDAVGHELDSRVGSRPSSGDLVGKDECRSPSVISAPAFCDFERASTGEHGTQSGRETAKVLALGSDILSVMGSDPPVWISTSPETYQLNTSAKPPLRSATKPSSDMDMIATTFDIAMFLSRSGNCVQESEKPEHTQMVSTRMSKWALRDPNHSSRVTTLWLTMYFSTVFISYVSSSHCNE